jgi:diacylglycerol O-acyltransferase / wax synthase
MSRVDTAWLRMDNDVNLMMIVGVWLLTPAITLARAARAHRRQAAEVRPLPPEGRVDTMGAQLGGRRGLRHRRATSCPRR